MSNISREHIEKAYEQGVEAIILLIGSIVKEYGNQLEELSKRLEELENQKAKNSHQPPSTDGFVKQTKSLRKKSERKVGGQEGQEGNNLPWQETADIVIKHEIVECQVCGYDLREVEGEIVEKRQVHDLPVIVETKIKEQIQESEVTHFDETGTNVNGKRLWLHVSSTKTHTHYQVHEKRGQAAMDAIGILPNYKGKAVHDGFKSYNQYQCSHYLGNAHHLRELIFIHERFNQPWAEEMIDLLCTINDEVKQAKLEEQTALEPSKISAFELQFQKIIDLGYKDNPEPVIDPDAPKTRGRKNDRNH